MENSCDFCGVVKESVTHLFFQCLYSRLFWVDVSNFISRMFGTLIHIGMYDVIFFLYKIPLILEVKQISYTANHFTWKVSYSCKEMG